MACQFVQELRDSIGEISIHIAVLIETIQEHSVITDAQKEDLIRELSRVVGKESLHAVNIVLRVKKSPL